MAFTSEFVMTSAPVSVTLAGMITASLLAAFPAPAAPPPNADPALAPWFQSLRQPETGMSCCDIADCRPTEYRTVGDQYEVWIEDQWLPVRYRSEEHTSELQSHLNLVCRLLLEKKKKIRSIYK